VEQRATPAQRFRRAWLCCVSRLSVAQEHGPFTVPDTNLD
jgi:hypothetical protein